MSEISIDLSVTARSRARCRIRERALLTFLLYTVARGGEAWAGDHASMADAAAKSDEASRPPVSATTRLILPSRPFDLSAADTQGYSATEFKPRSRSIYESAAAPKSANTSFGAPMAQDNSIWQQMAQFRSQDRVRLLTLWETRGSTISLQAGKHGGPSLQWSSPWMSSEGTSRGLFDRLFSPALRAGFSASRTSPARPAPTAAPSKSDSPALSVTK